MKNVKNAHMGTHLLVEVYNVPFEKLNDLQKIEETMVRAVKSEEFVKSGKILISEYPKIHENTKIIQDLQSSNQKT